MSIFCAELTKCRSSRSLFNEFPPMAYSMKQVRYLIFHNLRKTILYGTEVICYAIDYWSRHLPNTNNVFFFLMPDTTIYLDNLLTYISQYDVQSNEHVSYVKHEKWLKRHF